MQRYTPPANGTTAPKVKIPASLNGYATILTDADIEAEARARRKGLVFPLDVFPAPLQPMIASLITDLKGERAFVGLGLLQTASIAIGSSLVASTLQDGQSWETNLSVWGATVGISSSGKTMIQKQLLRPLKKIQTRLDDDYFEQLADKDREEKDSRKAIFINDITYEAMMKKVLPHNFKGIARYEDELVKWFDDLSRYKSGATELGFFLGSWSPADDYTFDRVGGGFIRIKQEHRCFSLMGGIQPSLVWRLFENDRDTSGFAFRFLWAFAEADRAISPNLRHQRKEDVFAPYDNMIDRLYGELKMNYRTDTPGKVYLTDEALTRFQQWQDQQTDKANAADDTHERDIRTGVLGKVKEYVLRFAGILTAMNGAFYAPSLHRLPPVSLETFEQAIRLGEYFMASGYEAYQVARQKLTIPLEVLQLAAEYRAAGYSQTRLAEMLGKSKQAVSAQLKKVSDKYPSAFGAKNS